MDLNNLCKKAFAYAKKQGFYDQPAVFGERLMLVVSELSEALEADRNGRWEPRTIPALALPFNHKDFKVQYEKYVRGSVCEELADAIIRICDLAGSYNIDLDWHVEAKMAYNESRPYKHKKKY
jgi:NTP pyrophosphatase (non-canonical NTP hydrolase)